MPRYFLVVTGDYRVFHYWYRSITVSRFVFVTGRMNQARFNVLGNRIFAFSLVSFPFLPQFPGMIIYTLARVDEDIKETDGHAVVRA